MDYLRQLRNDEKRATFSMVGTGTPSLTIDAEAGVSVPFFVIPKRSTIARIYTVTKSAFAAGATATIEVYRGSEDGVVLFTDLPLDTLNTVTMGDGDSAGRWTTANYVGIAFNQAAIDSVVGEFKVVVEFTEVPVCVGAYSK